MITVYYHPEKKSWYHCEATTDFVFGKTNHHVSYVGSKLDNSLPFPIGKDENKLGPIIGILTGSSQGKKSFIGNIPTLLNLQKALQSKGALGVVITPDSFKDIFVDGYTFYSPIKKWIKIRTPLPDVVYNRIPYRIMEDTTDFTNMVSFLKETNIPFFNPFFFSKWEIFQMLQSNDLLSPFLPHTILFQHKDDLKKMLEPYTKLYLKATNGRKGIGLYYLEYDNQELSLKSVEGYRSYSSFSAFWRDNKEVFQKGTYIIQQAIQSDTFEGNRYDLRILCHYQENIKGHIISGIGVRLAGENRISTHVPNGGSIIPYDRIATRFDDIILRSLVFNIGNVLNVQIGDFIGEFSIDLGRSTTGQYYVYEVNSKPMVFDEPHIKKRGLENLTQLLIMKAKTT
ncbi:YheC/YheD family protein [Fredinandcohnia humi]